MTIVRHLAVALLAAACGGAKHTTTDTTTPAAVEAFRPLQLGDTLPVLAQRTLAGDSLRLGGSGAPLTLVNVWATWCTSCREEMQDLEAIHRDFSPKGLRVVAVSVDEGDGTRVRRFIDHEKLTFAVTRDEGNRVQDAYRVTGVPETYLLGTDGRLLWHRTGGIHGGTQEARDAITKALVPNG
jgi:cytochrome c biogenesis protein CcmG, thiol:disulfide interchange protein DsbE